MTWTVTRPPRQTFTGRRFQDGQYMAIWVEGDRVVGDEPIQRVAPDGEGIQRWIVPGFVDLAADVDASDVRGFSEKQLQAGITRYLPTAVMDNEQIDALTRAMCFDTPETRQPSPQFRILRANEIGHVVVKEGLSFIEAIAMATTRPRMLMPDWSGKWGCFKGDPADMVELDWHEATGQITIRQVTVGGFAAHCS